MKKKNVLIAAVLTVVVVGSAVLASTDMLQGRFAGKFNPAKIYLYKGKYVSVVTSPVSTVETSEVSSTVTSEVSSKVGTSRVASKVSSKVTSEVPSVVTTPVASAVAVSKEWEEKAMKYEIKQLTASVLKKVASEDYKKNPSNFVISEAQAQQLLDMYQVEKSK